MTTFDARNAGLLLVGWIYALYGAAAGAYWLAPIQTPQLPIVRFLSPRQEIIKGQQASVVATVDPPVRVPLRVAWHNSDPDGNGIHYQFLDSDQLLFGPNQKQASVTLKAIEDGIRGNDKTVRLKLLPGNNYSVGSPNELVVALKFVPPPYRPPQLNIAASETDVKPGISRIRLTFKVDPPVERTVNAAFSISGSADSEDSDLGKTGRVSIPADNLSQSMDVAVNHREVYNDDRELIVSLHPSEDYVLGESASVSIILRSAASRPRVRLAVVGSFARGANASRGKLLATLTGDVGRKFAVPYAIAHELNGTTRPLSNDRIEFSPGEREKEVPVQLPQAHSENGDEALIVSLDAADAAGPTSLRIPIELMRTTRVAIRGIEEPISEYSDKEYAFSILVKPASEQPITVRYNVSPGKISHTLQSGKVTIPAHAAEYTLPIRIDRARNGLAIHDDETVTVTLLDSDGAELTPNPEYHSATVRLTGGNESKRDTLLVLIATEDYRVDQKGIEVQLAKIAADNKLSERLIGGGILLLDRDGKLHPWSANQPSGAIKCFEPGKNNAGLNAAIAVNDEFRQISRNKEFQFVVLWRNTSYNELASNPTDEELHRLKQGPAHLVWLADDAQPTVPNLNDRLQHVSALRMADYHDWSTFVLYLTSHPDTAKKQQK